MARNSWNLCTVWIWVKKRVVSQGVVRGCDCHNWSKRRMLTITHTLWITYWTSKPLLRKVEPIIRGFISALWISEKLLTYATCSAYAMVRSPWCSYRYAMGNLCTLWICVRKSAVHLHKTPRSGFISNATRIILLTWICLWIRIRNHGRSDPCSGMPPIPIKELINYLPFASHFNSKLKQRGTHTLFAGDM